MADRWELWDLPSGNLMVHGSKDEVERARDWHLANGLDATDLAVISVDEDDV